MHADAGHTDVVKYPRRPRASSPTDSSGPKPTSSRAARTPPTRSPAPTPTRPPALSRPTSA
eukprot:4227367-Pyramimonas_sp.AAC.1